MTNLSENFEIKNLLFLQKKPSEPARSIYQYYVTIPDLIFKQGRAMGSEILGWAMIALSAGLVTIGGFVSSIFAGRLIPVVQNASKYRLMRSALEPNFADRVDVMITASLIWGNRWKGKIMKKVI